MLRSKVWAAFFISILCLPSVSFGHEAFEGIWRGAKEVSSELEGVVLGAGVRYHTSPYIGDDDHISGVPIVMAKYKNFYIDGTSAGYYLNDDEELRFSAVIEPRLMGYDGDDSPELNGMEDRDWSVDGGLRMSWDHEYFLLRVTGLADLGNRHQGQEVKAMLSKELFEKFLTPRIGVKWQSEDLVDYYYGVKSDEVTASRPNYEPEGAVNYVTGVTAAYPLGDHWAVIGDFEFEEFGSEIQDSPIIEDDNKFSYILGAIYRF